MKLPKSFYLQEDVVAVTRKLIGKKLCTNINGIFTSGIIVEAEAYNGRTDKACHAYIRRTKRTEVIYQEGGIAYVYLCYGIHNLFNIVTNTKDTADAILIRAVQPVEGVSEMLVRRNMNKIEKKLTSGPGILTIALGIDKGHNGLSLSGNDIYIEDAEELPDDKIVATTRIGVDYAGNDASLPWRFYIKDNEWVSKK